MHQRCLASKRTLDSHEYYLFARTASSLLEVIERRVQLYILFGIEHCCIHGAFTMFRKSTASVSSESGIRGSLSKAVWPTVEVP